MKQYFGKTLQVISFKDDVYLAQAKLEKRYPHFKKSHFFYDIKYSIEMLSIYVLVCLKMLLTTVI